MKKTLRWVGIALLLPLLILCGIAGSLYIPQVQTWAVKKATVYASAKTGLNIQIGKVNITFPLDIKLQDVLVAEGTDKIAETSSVLVDLNLRHLFKLKIGIESIELQEGMLDTHDLIDNVHLRGQLERFQLKSKEVDLRKEQAIVTAALLEGCDMEVFLKEQEEKDTTASNSKIHWQLDLKDIAIRNSHMAILLPNDTAQIQATIEQCTLEKGDIQLANGTYQAKKIVLKCDSILYASSIAHDINLEAKNVYLDSNGIKMDALKFDLTHSSLQGEIDLQWAAFERGGDGRMDINMNANIAQQDVSDLLGSHMPQKWAEVYPKIPFQADIRMEGCVDSLQMKECHIDWPTILQVSASGWASHLTDSTLITGNLSCQIESENISCLRKYLKLKDVALPPMSLSTDIGMQGSKFDINAILHEGGGKLLLQGFFDKKEMEYDAKLNAQNLKIKDFLPKDSIYSLSAHGYLKGKGTDWRKHTTRLEALLDVDSLHYGKWNLNHIQANAKLIERKGTLEFNSHNDLIGMNACVDAEIGEEKTDATFCMDLNHIDLFALGIARDTLNASMILHIDGKSNLKDCHRVSVKAQAMELILKDTIYHPLDLHLDTELRPDTMFALAEAGDLKFHLNSCEGIDSLLTKTKNLENAIKEQLSKFYIDQDSLRTLLPDLHIKIESQSTNPVCNILKSITGYTYEDLNIQLNSNEKKGLNGHGSILALNSGTILLDSIQWKIAQSAKGVELNSRIKNKTKNKVAVFESLLHLQITPKGASGNIVFNDAKGRKGLDLGLEMEMRKDTSRIHFTPLNPIIAYRNFTLNEDNYIELTRDKHIQALIDLLADDGTGLKIYSTPNEEAQQDLSLSLNQFNVGELVHALPYLPDMGGLLHGDIHYMQVDSAMSVSADLMVQKMTFKGNPLGNVGMNAVYLPNNDGTHFVDGYITQEEQEIAFLSGSYIPQEDEEGDIEATMTLNHFPMNIVNSFIPNKMAELKGYAGGELNIGGKASTPIISGHLTTSYIHLASEMYSIDMDFPDDTIRVSNSHLSLNKLEAYTTGKSPLVLDGTIDFSDLEKISMNLTLNAKNYQLINAPKQRNAIAYGKVFVDANAILKGTLDNLKIRGNLGVLGNSDITYVLKDSPITVEDRLSGLVTFVNFNDSTETEGKAKDIRQNVDMQLIFSIEQAAHVHCLLSEDGTDYVELEGGGDLTMTYDSGNDFQLYGRYTILSGKMNYTLMSIVCKNFNIRNGSYIEFQGDLQNPILQIAAEERVKATVTDNNRPRTVAFDVGLNISQTLDNMGLEFTLKAPEDLSVQNELAGMSNEDRGRVAVTMLATNMYISNLTDSKAYSTTNALNSFLQNEINNLVGMAQNTIDVNFGMANSTSAKGTQQTDYSFSFTKRLWGNRINLILGGKVSTGDDAVNTGYTIIDNISLEYRLDQSATRYIKIYYDKNYESLLEGELTEMGAGIVLRKKSTKLGDLFIFKKHKNEKEARP